MNVGEFFVNLGVKGSEKSIDAITGLKKGLGELSDLSLEAKAGLVGAMYALEQLFSSSSRSGTQLANFTSLLGVSAKTLQEYQYAARQMGVANEDVTTSFQNMQLAMTKALIGQGKPAGLARLGMVTGAIGQAELTRWQAHPEELMQRLQEYARKEQNIGLRNETLKSFQLSDNMIVAMSRNAFNKEAFRRAPVYSEKEIAALDKARNAWGNLGNQIEMAVGRFNARHGVQLVKDISLVVDKVLKLAEAFTVLAEKLKIFEVFGKIFEGWGYIFNGITGAIDQINGIGNFKSAKEPGKNGPGQWFKEAASNDMESIKDFFGTFKYAFSEARNNDLDRFAPLISAFKGESSNQVSQEMNQTVHIHTDANPQKIGDSVKRATKAAYRQMGAQLQGT